MRSPKRLLLPVLLVALLGALWFCARLLDTRGDGAPLQLGGGEVQAAQADSLGAGGSAEGQDASPTGSREEIQLDPLAGLSEEELAALAGTEPDEGSRLFGTVVRAGGVPVEGARVLLRKTQPWLSTPADVEEFSALPSPGPKYEAESDAEGRFVLRDVAAGQVAISIRAAGFAPLARLNMPVPEHEGVHQCSSSTVTRIRPQDDIQVFPGSLAVSGRKQFVGANAKQVSPGKPRSQLP